MSMQPKMPEENLHSELTTEETKPAAADAASSPAEEIQAEITPSETFALQQPPVPPPHETKRASKDKEKEKEEASQSPFSITVGQVYDGPLDLLLDLIRKQNI